MRRPVVIALAVTAVVTGCGNQVSMPSIDGLVATPEETGGDQDGPADVDVSSPAENDGAPAADTDPPPGDGAPPGPVPVFVAEGHAGRLLMSCDDGRSWIHDQNDDPERICFVTQDCDHAPDSAAGLTYTDGWFFASFGHGSSMGTLRRSSDAVHWDALQTGNSQGGIHYDGELLLWMQGSFGISEDLGVTVQNNLTNVPGHYYLARTITADGSVILASGDDPGGLVSRDSGRTWATASLTDVVWGRNVLLATAADGSLITVSTVHADNGSTTAYAARSTDGGLTWVGAAAPIYDGAGYMSWSFMSRDGDNLVGFFANSMWTSSDGLTWVATPIATHLPAGNITDGAIARGPSGTYVTVTDVWANYYDKQRAYRSTDGIHWDALDAAMFSGGHPIRQIIAGYVDASVCP